MKVLLISPPTLKDSNDIDSITLVPPNGYGGVELVVYSIIYGLVELGIEVSLIGSPGSYSFPGLKVIRQPSSPSEIRNWIIKNNLDYDIVHDHSLGMVFDINHSHKINFNYVATHHKTGVSSYAKNVVYLSEAQRNQACDFLAPVIRLPIISQNYIYKETKDDFYLYMGRVDNFKGVLEAAKFCKEINSQLVIAGPSWDKKYSTKIRNQFSSHIKFEGEVSGLKKLKLLSSAKATFVLSKPVKGVWGDTWCEPGATIVAESAISGTPIISTNNGCLSEIVTKDIGVQIDLNKINNTQYLSSCIYHLPEPKTVRNYAHNEWGYLKIAKQYISLYKKVKNTYSW